MASIHGNDARLFIFPPDTEEIHDLDKDHAVAIDHDGQVTFSSALPVRSFEVCWEEDES